MPRPMTPAILAAFCSRGFSPVIFIQAKFNSGTVYLWTGYGSISWNGQTWLGLGSLLSLSTVEDAATVEARPVSFIASGFDPTLLPDCLGEVTLGAPVTIWLGALSATPNAGSCPENLTSNTSNPPFVASASSATVEAAWLAFNGATANGWGTAGLPCWLQLDIGAGNGWILDSYGIAGGYAGAPNGPQAWTLEGSNDGSTWTTLDTQTGQTTGWGFAGGGAILNNYTIAAPGTTAYRYFRLNITANNGGALTEIDELYLNNAAPTPNGLVIPDPVILWSGGLDQPTIDIDPKTATINFLCENLLVAMNVAIDRRYSQQDQQMGWPLDLGFSFVNALQENDILWWGQAPNNLNNDPG
jgi:F5/8 type C domain